MKIGIIAAMQVEAELLIGKLENVIKKEICCRTFYSGYKDGKDIIIVVAGIGKVNAAITTQCLIDNYNVDLIINTGIAGSLKKEIKLLDIVVAEKLAYHDFNLNYFGYNLGQVPGEDSRFFEVSTDILENVLDIAKNNDISVHKDIIVSGDQFINKEEIKNEIINNFGAGCVEMESTAIAHVCLHNKKQFIIIRSISDNADDEASITYEELEQKAAKNSSDFVEKILKDINL